MTCANRLKALRQGIVEKHTKFHLSITIDIWVGGNAVAVSRQQVIHDTVTVLIDKVYHTKLNAESLCYGVRVLDILLPGAVPRDAFIIDPVLHVATRDLMPLLQ